MHELEITWKRAIHVWWAWAWRALVFSLVAGGGVGFVIGFLGVMLGYRNLGPLITVLGFVIGVVVAVATLVTALKKRYPGFRIAFVAHSGPLP